MIKDHLLPGKENAISARMLCRILGITTRELTLEISSERRAGFPICASCDSKRPGYYIAENRGEMRDYCASLSHRISEIEQTREACEACAENLPEVWT